MPLRLIDTHCQIQFRQYDVDRDDVIAQAQRSNIGMIIVGCDYESSAAAIQCAESIGAHTWAAVGQHPNDSREVFEYEKFFQLGASSFKVVAIGETGLDWYRLPEGIDIQQEKTRQQELFERHIALSKALSKPLIIHSRNTHTEIIEILSSSFGEWKEGDSERGVLHCFTGTLEQAEVYLKLGFLISFTGIITFASQYDEIVKNLPLEKLLVETDAPYLTPVPFRGKRNVPMYVEFVVDKVASLRGVSSEEVARQTTENAKRLFRLE
ncbi:MAG: TatD family hydrolase [Patescibacteria group bacterium]